MASVQIESQPHCLMCCAFDSSIASVVLFKQVVHQGWERTWGLHLQASLLEMYCFISSCAKGQDRYTQGVYISVYADVVRCGGRSTTMQVAAACHKHVEC